MVAVVLMALESRLVPGPGVPAWTNYPWRFYRITWRKIEYETQIRRIGEGTDTVHHLATAVEEIWRRAGRPGAGLRCSQHSLGGLDTARIQRHAACGRDTGCLRGAVRRPLSDASAGGGARRRVV